MAIEEIEQQDGEKIRRVCMAKKRDITSITPTVCALMGIQFPPMASGPLKEVLVFAESRLPGRICRKMLIFCPDAIGSFLYDKYPVFFAEIQKAAPFKAELQSVFPGRKAPEAQL